MVSRPQERREMQALTPQEARAVLEAADGERQAGASGVRLDGRARGEQLHRLADELTADKLDAARYLLERLQGRGADS